MKENRRNFMKGTGAACALAFTNGLPAALTRTELGATESRGMARGLTVLSIRRGSECRLGVKNEKGVLDVVQAAKILRMPAPATIDELLQNEDVPSLNALVDAAMKSKAAQKALLKEETIEFGPVVSRPEKIICVGLNYRQHAIEIGAPIPKQPVLFNKFNTTLNHHNGTIKLPVEFATKFDYEVELVMAIGREAKVVNEADFLSKVSSKFHTQIGVTPSPKWPVGQPAERSSDMADKVKNIPGSLGYVEYQYAVKANLS
jgi:hypothetical protein